MDKIFVRLTESELRGMIREEVSGVLAEELSARDRWFMGRTRLKAVFDLLRLKPGEYTLTADMGYKAIELYDPEMQIREYDNGKIFVHYGYDDSVGAWGGFTRKCEVGDISVFKSPKWKSIIMGRGGETTPDVIMI